MNSHTTDEFRKLLAHLPSTIQKQAKESFRQFEKDPYYPGLRFKRVSSKRPIYSVRISIDYRVLGVLKENEIIWFWIGSHSDYDKMLIEMNKK